MGLLTKRNWERTFRLKSRHGASKDLLAIWTVVPRRHAVRLSRLLPLAYSPATLRGFGFSAMGSCPVEFVHAVVELPIGEQHIVFMIFKSRYDHGQLDGDLSGERAWAGTVKESF